MSSFINLPHYIHSVIGVCFVVMFMASAAIIVSGIRHKRWWGVTGLLPISICLYIATQCVFYNIHTELETEGAVKRLVDIFAGLPWLIYIIVLIIVGILEVEVFRNNRKWAKEHITDLSIKEAIDNLPVGICCYMNDGQVVLKNYRVERFCRAYTGKPLLNATTFLEEIAARSKKTENGPIIQMENGEVFTFSDQVLKDESTKLRMLSLADITEQYKSTEVLEEKRRLVEKLNEELVLHGRQIVDSITAREILEAKVKIHDELGVNLLASKHYILSGGTLEEQKDIEAVLRRNLEYLKQENEKTAKDEYMVILETANKLDIKLNMIGNLTALEPQRHIIVTAIHECLTNTIRHAMGDELTVRIDEDDIAFKVELTNNGNVPKGKITERGGLLLLRALVEKHAGTMEIESKPKFVLRLVIKK